MHAPLSLKAIPREAPSSTSPAPSWCRPPQGLGVAKQCLDAAHRAVRLGNPMVAMSKVDRVDFAAIYDGNVRRR